MRPLRAIIIPTEPADWPANKRSQARSDRKFLSPTVIQVLHHPPVAVGIPDAFFWIRLLLSFLEDCSDSIMILFSDEK